MKPSNLTEAYFPMQEKMLRKTAGVKNTKITNYCRLFLKKMACHQMLHFAKMIKIDSSAFTESIICSVQNYDCCKGNCKNCVSLDKYQQLIDCYNIEKS